MFKFVHPAQIFAVNSKPKFTTLTIGQEKTQALIVDKFYKYPERVREFFLSSPAPIWKVNKGSRNFKDYHDGRHDISLRVGFETATNYLSHIIKTAFGADVRFSQRAITNVFQLIKPQPKDTTAFPHCDYHPDIALNLPFNAVAFLNTEREARGGTAFYRHRATGLESIPLKRKPFMDFHKKYLKGVEVFEDGSTYWCPYKKNWEKIDLIEMKFNRLVIFPSEVFHGAWHEPGWFKSYPRLNQVFFLERG